MRLVLIAIALPLLACRSGKPIADDTSAPVDKVDQEDASGQADDPEDRAAAECPPTAGLDAACTPELGPRLTEERACADAFNRRLFHAALRDKGLAPVDDLPRDDGELGHSPAGPTTAEEGAEWIQLGRVRDTCGRPNEWMAELTRDADGGFWLAHPSGEVIHQRTYVECGCAYQCGGTPAPSPVARVALPPGATLAGTIDVPVEHLRISVIGSESCPPLP